MTFAQYSLRMLKWLIDSRVTDDRGRRFRVFNPARMRFHAGAADVRAKVKARIRLARTRHLAERPPRTASLPVAVTAFVGWTLLTWSFALVASPTRWIVVAFGPLVWAVLLWVVKARDDGHIYVAETVSEILRCGCCPSCLYPIADLPAESDMRVPCPECGAAWKSRRVGSLVGRGD